MKVLLEIKDNKAAALLKALKDLSYVKTKTIPDEKAALIKSIKTAVKELALIQQGKLKGISEKELFDGL